MSQADHCAMFPSALRDVAHHGLPPEDWYRVHSSYSLPLYRKGNIQGPLAVVHAVLNGKRHSFPPSVGQGSDVSSVVAVVDVVVTVVVGAAVVVCGDELQSGSEQKSLAVKIPSSLTPVAHQLFPSVETEGTHLS